MKGKLKQDEGGKKILLYSLKCEKFATIHEDDKDSRENVTSVEFETKKIYEKTYHASCSKGHKLIQVFEKRRKDVD